MARITAVERDTFHAILDDSIHKLDSLKNRRKIHWSTLSIDELQKKINVENAELEEAVHVANINTVRGIELVEDECYDLINLSLFIIDNLRGNE